MTTLVALENETHSQLKVDIAQVEEVGADLHMLPVVISEFQELVVQYPILFAKHEETGRFQCVALMGLEEGENLFWQGGKSHSIYTPLNIARHPFFLGQDESSGDNFVICIDEDSPSVSALRGESLFDDSGKATEFLNRAQSILAALLQGEKHTNDWIECLVELELLVPLTLDITFENNDTKQIKGLYSVDEDKLNGLAAEELKSLQQSGALSAIYTQLASLGQIYALIDRKNRRLSKGSPWFKASGE